MTCNVAGKLELEKFGVFWPYQVQWFKYFSSSFKLFLIIGLHWEEIQNQWP